MRHPSLFKLYKRETLPHRSASYSPQKKITAIMDVFLDVLDTFVFDRFYASIAPDHFTGANNSTLFAQDPNLNRHVRVYYPLEPSQWAESSVWKRDDIARQSFSLFLIAW